MACPLVLMVFGNDSLSNMYAFFQIVIVVTVVIITKRQTVNIQENDLRIENVTGPTIKLPKCDNIILVACFYRLANLQEEWFTITMLLHVQHLSQSKITVLKYLCLPHQSKIIDIMHFNRELHTSY